MQLLDRSHVTAEEIDSLGHLNVRFYLARVERANAALLAQCGIDAALLAMRDARLRRIDTYCAFRREQFEGAELTVLGGRLELTGAEVRCYFEIRNPAREEIAATFITGTQLVGRTTRVPLDLPAAAREANAAIDVALPAYAAPRSLSLARPRTDVRLAALAARIGESAEFGMTGSREGVIDAEDCGPDGVLRDDVELMFVMHRNHARRDGLGDRGMEASADGSVHATQIELGDAKSFGPPVMYTDEGHRFGWAMLETRNLELARPRAGDRIVWIGADVAIAEKSRRTRRWAFVKASGELLSIHDSVGIAMDLDARKAIPIPRSLRAAMDGHYLPEFADDA